MLIQTSPQLVMLCDRLAGHKEIALDLEFVGEGRYYPTPGTLQIATASECVLVDLVTIRDLKPLHRALLDSGMIKVFHAGKIDLEILERLLGTALENVFDTQIAGALLGYGEQVSLASLLKLTIGLEAKKEHAFTDWTRRPLSKEQVEYALNDVRHLLAVYDVMKRELVQKERLAWAKEEFLALENSGDRGSRDERELYKSIKGAANLSQAQLDRLRELAAWRELKARHANLPPAKLLLDETLIELARRPRKSVAQLSQIRGFNNRMAEKYGEELLRLEAPRNGDHAEPVPREEFFPARWEATVDFLSLCLRSLAEEKSISPGLLANRSALRELIRRGEAANIRLLQGWRLKAAGETLLRALSGQASVTIAPAERQVLVKWVDFLD